MSVRVGIVAAGGQSPPIPLVLSTGFAMGGRIGLLNIDSFPFAAPFVTATDFGDLSSNSNEGTGLTSGIAGDLFVAGGATTSVAPTAPTTSVIQRFPFSSPFTSATDIGDLNRDERGAVGAQSSTDGFVTSGIDNTPVVVGIVNSNSFPFSSPFATASDVGDISEMRKTAAGASSATDGHISGGANDTGFANSNVQSTIWRFPFSSPFTSETDIGDLSLGRRECAGQQNDDDGFVSGGWLSGGGGNSNRIDRFPFSSPFTLSTDIGNLSVARRELAGSSSADDGFSSGGASPFFDTVDSFPFSSPFATASDVGNLTANEARHAGTQG